MIDCNAKDKVWIKDGNNFKAVGVTTGITNGTLTEILSGLKEGQDIITEVSLSATSDESADNTDSNPFMPGPPDKNKKKSTAKDSSASAGTAKQ